MEDTGTGNGKTLAASLAAVGVHVFYIDAPLQCNGEQMFAGLTGGSGHEGLTSVDRQSHLTETSAHLP